MEELLNSHGDIVLGVAIVILLLREIIPAVLKLRGGDKSQGDQKKMKAMLEKLVEMHDRKDNENRYVWHGDQERTLLIKVLRLLKDEETKY